MRTESWIDLAVALVALGVLFLAALVETSLATVNRVTLRELIEGRPDVQRAQSLLERPQAIRSAMLLIELMAALVAAVAFTRLFGRELTSGAGLVTVVAGALALILVGRVLPGVLAPEDRGDTPSHILRLGAALAIMAAPLVTVTDAVTRLLGAMVPAARNGENGASDQDDSSRPEGVSDDLALEADEQEMISGILSLEEATARDIMVPRLDIVAVPADTPVTTAVDLIRQHGHSRIPVYGESIDSIIGVVYAKDLLRFVREDPSTVSVLDLIRPAYFVPESKRVDELLHDLQHEKIHMAVVVDEYGGTAGIATIEDILEEIVGEIQDEYDREVPLIERVGADEAIVDGRISVDEIADIFDTDFAEGEGGTVGGFVQKRLGRIPEAGEVVRADGLLIEVQAVEQHRIRKLRVTRSADAGVAGADSEAGAA